MLNLSRFSEIYFYGGVVDFSWPVTSSQDFPTNFLLLVLYIRRYLFSPSWIHFSINMRMVL